MRMKKFLCFKSISGQTPFIRTDTECRNVVHARSPRSFVSSSGVSGSKNNGNEIFSSVASLTNFDAAWRKKIEIENFRSKQFFFGRWRKTKKSWKCDLSKLKKIRSLFEFYFIKKLEAGNHRVVVFFRPHGCFVCQLEQASSFNFRLIVRYNFWKA